MEDKPLFRKEDERNTYAFLKTLDFVNELEYEPDGNVPPDFLINIEIAVEVTRLNYVSGGKYLEDDRHSILEIIERVLNEFQNVSFKNSAFLSLCLKRPLLNKTKKYKKIIRKILKEHIYKIELQETYIVDDFLEISIIPVQEKFARPYELGTISDLDAAGFLIAKVFESFKFKLQKKYQKFLCTRTSIVTGGYY